MTGGALIRFGKISFQMKFFSQGTGALKYEATVDTTGPPDSNRLARPGPTPLDTPDRAARLQ